MNDTPKTPEVEDLIRYDILAQEALREVVKKVLKEVSRTGLPGDHHFYITFDTNYAGVRMSDRMKEKYPEEMTIVVQHQYWDLETSDSGFSIGLSFDNIPETMAVPYASIRGFFDPAVQFGLQFDASENDDQGESAENADDATVSALPSPPKVKKIAKSKSEVELKAEEKSAAKKEKSKPEKDEKSDEADAEAESADVVSLDAFRKK